MKCQKKKFYLEFDDTTYINAAYMSPLLRSVEEAGIRGLRKKRLPYKLQKKDFFDHVDLLRSLYNQLINGDADDRIVVIPSASYALANIARNLPDNGRKDIVVLENQFPSNFYIWKQVAEEKGFRIKPVRRPESNDISWSKALRKSIDENTLCVAIPMIHWGDGTVFNIQKISDQAKSKGALLVIDGTQSIGAMPYDQQEVQADALVVSAYKWLLGPYNTGLAYIGKAFDNGTPIEESWLNRVKSDDFQFLTNYQDSYRPGARRYEVGEAPDFIKTPMLIESIKQLLKWEPAGIQEYCKKIVDPIVKPLLEAGLKINERKMVYHLFGVRLPEHVAMDNIKEMMEEKKISVSYRKDAIRISPYVYNKAEDLEKLKNVLLDASK